MATGNNLNKLKAWPCSRSEMVVFNCEQYFLRRHTSACSLKPPVPIPAHCPFIRLSGSVFAGNTKKSAVTLRIGLRWNCGVNKFRTNCFASRKALHFRFLPLEKCCAGAFLNTGPLKCLLFPWTSTSAIDYNWWKRAGEGVKWSRSSYFVLRVKFSRILDCAKLIKFWQIINNSRLKATSVSYIDCNILFGKHFNLSKQPSR